MFMWPEDNNKIISETNIASQFIQVDFLDWRFISWNDNKHTQTEVLCAVVRVRLGGAYIPTLETEDS